MSETTTVPVVRSFGDDEIIGELRILTSALPSTPDYVLTLGYRQLSKDEYALREVAIVDDRRYAEYLRSKGKL